MSPNIRLAGFAIGIGCSIYACLAATVIAQEPSDAKRVTAAECGSIGRLHVCGDIFLAGQPSEADLKLLKDRGVKTIINLRTADELDWDEAGAVRALGMKYVHVPVGSPDDLTDASFGKLCKLLKDADGNPTVLHCASANRVGAVWLAHRIADDGLDYEAALKEAEQVGLRSPALRDKAKQYVEKKR